MCGIDTVDGVFVAAWQVDVLHGTESQSSALIQSQDRHHGDHCRQHRLCSGLLLV